MRFYLNLICFIAFLASGYALTSCKNTSTPLGHQGPFDIPTSTATTTSTPGPVTINCSVNYNGTQTGVGWNLVDPNGNTINSSLQASGAPFSFIPIMFGVYTINIPTQTEYLYSSQPLTITGSGNYSSNFSCSNQILTANPSTINYSSNIGYQVPATISYSYTGNLNVPVTINTSNSNAGFSISANSGITLSSSSPSTVLTITKNAAYILNTSYTWLAKDLIGNSTGANATISINRGFSIPVTFYWSVGSFSTSGPSGVLANYTLSINDGGLTIPTSSSYSYQTTFQPSNGPNPVTYSGSLSYSAPTTFQVNSTTVLQPYFNGTGVTITLPDGSTRSCSGCVTFTEGTPVPNDPIITTSY